MKLNNERPGKRLTSGPKYGPVAVSLPATLFTHISTPTDFNFQIIYHLSTRIKRGLCYKAASRTRTPAPVHALRQWCHLW